MSGYVCPRGHHNHFRSCGRCAAAEAARIRAGYLVRLAGGGGGYLDALLAELPAGGAR